MKKKTKQHILRSLPAVDTVLCSPGTVSLIEKYGQQIVAYVVRKTIMAVRKEIGKKGGAGDLSIDRIIHRAEGIVTAIIEPSLRPVINATGVVLHTNLGRAPLGDAVLNEITPIIRGYSNVEFDLEKGGRGHRVDHVAELLRYLTGAEDVMVVNNNAAAVILTLHTLAHGREVIISRGELIEIGGAFRIPEIMAAAGVHMVEVGTTNRTRLSDYKKAVGRDTALIVKSHKSNYTISGFTEEVSVRDLAGFARSKRIPLLYDIGSGLLRKPLKMDLAHEPDVRKAIADGADVVAFSGDKLLGGPQAGIIAGRSRLVRRLAAAPLMRALRVGKITLAALSSACRNYLKDELLIERNPLFMFLERDHQARQELADSLLAALRERDITADSVRSFGQIGGGTLPDVKVPSHAVRLVPPSSRVRERMAFSEAVYHGLMRGRPPILAILREGNVLFDVFALNRDDIPLIADRVAFCIRRGAAL
ncbi:MAG: L-seryl-tRNA(Sec) selenium transferase [Chitinispirillaceae bacterium]|nr:L-seryl-tRNA(Sec) selenium transferase [Chitinispirillaceae bacterium]